MTNPPPDGTFGDACLCRRLQQLMPHALEAQVAHDVARGMAEELLQALLQRPSRDTAFRCEFTNAVVTGGIGRQQVEGFFHIARK